ncbi:hypothetical protein [Evansella cellulosilytica]|uniref:Uncharacterized protein n=1 Tax=Evansella cellulosilytica (strain ATCC 21833 / DSM 2522 / FERM P-1141 / JCM 9156 / N-4) TaxID=649639 RepID=E6U1J0_EVAC2|nr:hypothetical protein [Evansella cellulosilytica]ADU30353.1 hypothetical protein Bcell_2092 [Evansella cellulosilytica DSM 2522]
MLITVRLIFTLALLIGLLGLIGSQDNDEANRMTAIIIGAMIALAITFITWLF